MQTWYRNFLEYTFFDLIVDVPLHIIQNVWYQHDGAPSHHGKQVIDWLDVHFANKWIDQRGPIHWTLDMNHLDYIWRNM